MKVHHIGSTSIKHLSAKPIIDIAIELDAFKDGLKCVSGLERLGYTYKGTHILPDIHYFSKGEPRTHQIHIYQRGSEYLKKQIKFRDYLIDYEEDRIKYQELKEKLSDQNMNDKFTYADAKTEFINTILLKATQDGSNSI